MIMAKSCVSTLCFFVNFCLPELLQSTFYRKRIAEREDLARLNLRENVLLNLEQAVE